MDIDLMRTDEVEQEIHWAFEGLESHAVGLAHGMSVADLAHGGLRIPA